jgi:uncharacterized protein YfbU (UPF0304 family)
MKLDKYQRLALFNQYEILKQVDPDNREDYERNQEIVSSGFEGAYSWLAEHIYDPVPAAVCEEVISILDMYRAFDNSQKSGGFSTTEHWAQFQGFDGNGGTGHYGFACFLLDKEGKWEELHDRPRNSHSRSTLDKYRSMLTEWKRAGERPDLSQAEIEAIARA